MVQSTGHPDLQTSPRYILFVGYSKILCNKEMLQHDMRTLMGFFVDATHVNVNPNSVLSDKL